MSHQQLLADLAVRLQALTAQVTAARLGCQASTVSHTRKSLGKVEEELAQLACAARLAGAMTEEARAAFEGVTA